MATTSFVERKPPMGSHIGMTISHGQISHPTYGSATCNTIIPLLLPAGQYPHPTLKSDPSILPALVNRLLPEYRPIWPDDLDTDIILKLQDYITIAAYTVPTGDIGSPTGELVIAVILLGLVMDDVMDNLQELDAVQFQEIQKINKTLSGLTDGSLKSSDDIPNPLPALEPLNSFLWNFVEKSHSLGLWGSNGFLIGQIQECVTGHVLLMEAEAKRFSEASRDYFRSFASGGSSVLELVARLRECVVPAELRQNILFQRLKFCLGNVTDAMNDVIGLGRDIEKGQVKDSSILAAVMAGKSLQEAWDSTLGVLLENMMDIRFAVGKLKDLYKDDEGVQKYLRVTEEYVDGQFYAYAEIGRYGAVGMKVVLVD